MEPIKILGHVIGYGDEFEYVDDTAGFQVTNFRPDTRITSAPTSDYIFFDIEEGIWRTYDDKGETAAQGNIFNFGPIFGVK